MEEEIQRTRKYNEAKHFREKIFKRAVEYHGGYVEYHGGWNFWQGLGTDIYEAPAPVKYNSLSQSIISTRA